MSSKVWRKVEIPGTIASVSPSIACLASRAERSGPGSGFSEISKNGEAPGAGTLAAGALATAGLADETLAAETLASEDEAEDDAEDAEADAKGRFATAGWAGLAGAAVVDSKGDERTEAAAFAAGELNAGFAGTGGLAGLAFEEPTRRAASFPPAEEAIEGPSASRWSKTLLSSSFLLLLAADAPADWESGAAAADPGSAFLFRLETGAVGDDAAAAAGEATAPDEMDAEDEEVREEAEAET